MRRISTKYIAVTSLLAAINIVGLFLIHHDLTRVPKPTVRVLSLAALPDANAADRLSLTFDRQMVQPEAVGEVEKAEVFKLSPKWPGEWIWSAPDKLDYMLAKRLPAGRVFRISSTQQLEHRTGRAIEGDSEFVLKTKSLVLDRSELVAFDDQDVTFRVVFNQPVDPGDLLRHVSVYDDKTRAKLGEPTCPTKTQQADLVLRFRRPESNRFEMVLDEHLTGFGAELGLGRRLTCSYEIPRGFSLLNTHATRPTMEEIASVRLGFSHELNAEQELSEIRIEPSAERVNVYRNSRNIKPQKLTLDLRDLLPISTGIYRISANATNTRWTSSQTLLIITDLAITTKAERDGSLVWVTSLRTGQPVSDVQVKALSFNNQTLSSAITDSDGIARLQFAGNHPDGNMWVITARKDGDLSYIQPQNNQWVIDDVPQSGRPYARNYEVMLYTERGVYRPGDVIHITAVLRGRAGDTPPPFPLAIKVVRPDGRQVTELIAKPLDADQGVFHAEFATRTDCQTGPYRFRACLPGSDEVLGSIQALVECFVPVRMEVTAEPGADRFGPDAEPSIEVSGRYLWDAPAANVPVTVTGSLQPIRYQSKKYADYKFGHKAGQRIVSLPDSKSELDKEGRAEMHIPLPESVRTGLYRMRLSVTVTEPGGRSVSANTSATLDALNRHIGIRLPSGQVVSVGKPTEVKWVRRTGDDESAPEGELRMRLARVHYDTVLRLVNNRHVWKSTERTSDIGSERVVSASGAEGSFEIVCPDPGTYRIILTDGQVRSTSSLQFYASEHTAGPQAVPMNQPERLEIVTDRDKYVPGQTAKVLIRSPIAGRFLLTVENDSVVATHTGTIKNNTAELQVPLTEDLRGAVFLTATVLRAVDPGQQTWLPHRAMGMTRVLLDHTSQELAVEITAPASAEPAETIRVTVDTGLPTDPNRPTLVHLWAVDEGILLTTYYETPDLHEFFLGPRRCGVATADVFLRLLPDYRRPAGTARIGAGDFEIDSLRRNPVGARHRQAAVVWREATSVDENGQVSVEFKLPDLIGQMRLMAVVVDHDRYGGAEQAIILTSPLIVETTWPRFAAPGDEFEVPVKLFNSTQRPLAVQVKTSISGPLEVVADESLERVTLNPDQPAALVLQAKATGIGPAEVTVEALELGAIGEPLAARSQATFSVRPASALHSEVQVKALRAGEEFRIHPPESFVAGTARMTVSISSRPSVQLGPALEELIRYSYGCVEQTSSRLFSLLYASDVLADDRTEMIDSMAKAGIARLWSMQTRSGGLSYWPGGSTADLWGTAYAASCLVEAKNAGFEIDSQFTAELTEYLEQRLKTAGNDSPDLNTEGLICRVLAVFGEPPHGWMARLAEQKDQLDLAAVSHLAAAFHAAGHKDSATALIPEQLPQNLAKTTTSGRLTSPVRQQAVLLSVLLEIDPENPAVILLARRLDEARQQCRWGSTLNNATAIAALSRYQAIASREEQDFSGTVKLAGREVTSFDHTRALSHTFENISEPVDISTDGSGTIYVVVLSEGLAGKGLVKPFDRGLRVRRDWIDHHGNPIDPDKLSMGDLVCVKATVSTPGAVVGNIAIVDALPAGMEVENPRLATSAGSHGSRADRPDHVEFLDDRVVLFCTAAKDEKTFEYALRATAGGEFALPPIQASCMYEPAMASVGPEGQVIILSRRERQARKE